MDLHKILHELHTERHRLGKIIATLEELHERPPEIAPALKKRGRKGMDAAARKAVSQRMKRYWEARRAEGAKGASPKTGK